MIAQQLTNIISVHHVDLLETAWSIRLLHTAGSRYLLILQVCRSICLFYKCADTVHWKRCHTQERGSEIREKEVSTRFTSERIRPCGSAVACRKRRGSQWKSSKCLIYQGADNAFWLCTVRTERPDVTTDICFKKLTNSLSVVKLNKTT